ncbi:MAG: SDR family oxidoreductase [Chloroflexia bacterium]
MYVLEGKTALVTGGSAGFGRSIVSALANEGADVWALARDAGRLDQLKAEVKGVQTLVGDVTDPKTAPQVMHDLRPQVLVLNAGATPDMGPVSKLSWEQFSRNWETDTFMTFAFGKEALQMPLAEGSVVVIMSSGAAVGGSALSGGYAGAKRMQWFLAGYMQQEADALGLNIRFVAMVPRQLVGTTELGRKAVKVYSAQQGISEEEFLGRFGTPLTPELVGRGVVELITNPAYAKGTAFAISSNGLEALA